MPVDRAVAKAVQDFVKTADIYIEQVIMPDQTDKRCRRPMAHNRYVWYILGVFLLLLAAYLAFAWLVLAPLGYYGSPEAPRFADPWVERAETILRGGKLYVDVFTTTPPLVNYLLIPPAVLARNFGYRNPGTTIAFMVYFSVYNLFVAYLLYFAAPQRARGYRWALAFLLNPLTMGNSILRRQDESIVVTFYALALLYYVRKRHATAGAALGLGLLTKLTGGMMIPAALFNTRNWRYAVVPFLVFGLVFAPFYLQAGKAAIFWDVGQEHTEHPFQFGGVSFGALWTKWQGNSSPDTILSVYSALFVAGVLLVLGYIAWRPTGLLSDLVLLITTVLLLSAKLHCGYFLFLVFALAPFAARNRRLLVGYMTFSLLALAADMYKWPIERFDIALALMVGVYAVLIATVYGVRRCAVEASSPEFLNVLKSGREDPFQATDRTLQS